MPHIRESFADMLESEGKLEDPGRQYRITTPARLPVRLKEGYKVEVEKVNGSAGEVFTLISRMPPPPPAPRRAARDEAWAKSVPSRKKVTRKGVRK